MYCKKCGKKLADGARFCDRCGQTTKASSNRDSKKRPANTATRTRRTQDSSFDRYDRYRKVKLKKEAERKRRQKKVRVITLWAIVLGVFAAIGCGIYAHYYTMQNLNSDWKNKDESVKMNQEDENKANGITTTPEATEQSKPTETPQSKSTEIAKLPDNDNCNIYIDSAYGFKVPYPKSFQTGTLKNSKTRLSLADPEGDGSMMICYEKVSEKTDCATLMRDYAKGLGGTITDNRADEGKYTITFERNDKINHRMAVLRDNQYIYYDFTYGINSEKSSEYKEYLDYFDKYLGSDN